VIGPRTGIRERVERDVESDQANDLVAGGVIELLEGNLADNPLAEITPSPSRRRRRDEGHGYRESEQMSEQVQVMAQSAALLK
jgi:hypothetical protein